jgi:hypothetical protein
MRQPRQYRADPPLSAALEGPERHRRHAAGRLFRLGKLYEKTAYGGDAPFAEGAGKSIGGEVVEVSIGPLIAGVSQVCFVRAGIMVLFEVMAS